MSKYFTLEEMTRSQTAVRLKIDNTPNATQKRDLLRLMDYLDGIREAFGQPIRVTSGFRSWGANKAVGGVKNSQHLAGQAADQWGEDSKRSLRPHTQERWLPPADLGEKHVDTRFHPTRGGVSEGRSAQVRRARIRKNELGNRKPRLSLNLNR